MGDKDNHAANANVSTSVHRWMVMPGKDFATIAKDLPAFHRLFIKCVSHSLGLPSGCIEIVNVTKGSIIVEFFIHSNGRAGCESGASAALDLLVQQIATPHSALRKGQLGTYVEGAELLAGEPKPRVTAQPAVVVAAATDGVAPAHDQAVQTDTAFLPTPRPPKVPSGKWNSPESQDEA